MLRLLERWQNSFLARLLKAKQSKTKEGFQGLNQSNVSKNSQLQNKFPWQVPTSGKLQIEALPKKTFWSSN